MNGKILVILLVFFVAIRCVNLPAALQFGSDEGRDFLAVWEMYTRKIPEFIGPPSEYSINGQQFHFGPAPYYVVLPGLLLGDWDPLFVSYYLIIIHAVILGISIRMIGKRIKDTNVLLSFVFFLVFHPAVITYTRAYWNPYFTFSVSLILLALLVQKKQQIKRFILYYTGIGFLLGLGLQFHYAFIFAITICLIWLWVDKKVTRYASFLLLCGFIAGVLPLLLYELFYNFYNIRTFWLVLTNIRESSGTFHLHTFYLISLLPFLFYLLSFAIAHLQKYFRYLMYGVFGLGIFWSVMTVMQPPASQLSYQSLQELSAFIIQDQRQGSFNVVDQLTRDNRAMALRYMVTVNGAKPLGVADYQQATVLYLYTTAPLAALLTNPVYELQSDVPFVLQRSWQTTTGITLYKLQRIP